MDVFSETLVKRKYTPKDKTKIKILFATLLCCSVIFILVIPFLALTSGLAYITTASLAIYGIIIFVVWRTLKKMQLEYEYIIVNDTLDVDMIVAQKKRSRLITIELKTVEAAGRYTQGQFEGRAFETVIHAEKNLEGHENFYITLSHPTARRTLIVLTPNEAMLSALHKTLPRQIEKTLPSSLA